MLEWSVTAFSEAGVAAIVVAVPPGESLPLFENPAIRGTAEGQLRVVEGGETRSQSVATALAGVETELVAIHDAARPLVTPELIAAVVATLEGDTDAAGAIAAAPITDTVKQTASRSAGGRAIDSTKPASTMHSDVNADFVVDRTLDRDTLWAAQTPQVFRIDALRPALEADSDAVATDEAMLVEAAGGRVLICPAPAENVKVTTAADLLLAEQLLSRRSAQQ